MSRTIISLAVLVSACVPAPRDTRAPEDRDANAPENTGIGVRRPVRVTELARAAGAASGSVNAAHDGLSAAVELPDAPPPCSYPRGATAIDLGATIPAFSWRGAYRPDGTQFDFSLEDVFCDEEYADKTAIAFIVGAGWCGPCSEYTQALNNDAAAIESAGAVIVYVEAETAAYQPASNAYANTHIGHLIGSGPGVRAGDADTEPRSGAFLDSPLTTQFPTAFVARKSDMKIIVNQAEWNDVLPFAQIARHPDADWSRPNRPPEVSNCGPSEEEAGEPNDGAAEATVIRAGSFDGGVCNGQADFYRIDHAGTWTLELEFSHAIGDIDVLLWNEATNEALRSGGRTIGSESGDDNESFTHSGPSLVRVFGYAGATAPYVLRLTAR